MNTVKLHTIHQYSYIELITKKRFIYKNGSNFFYTVNIEKSDLVHENVKVPHAAV